MGPFPIVMYMPVWLFMCECKKCTWASHPPLWIVVWFNASCYAFTTPYVLHYTGIFFKFL